MMPCYFFYHMWDFDKIFDQCHRFDKSADYNIDNLSIILCSLIRH